MTDDLSYWERCTLTIVHTDPPRHELRLPCGRIMRLKTGDFFDVRRFTILHFDTTISFPPLPEKKQGQFLRALLEQLIAKRTDIEAPAEASDRGMLLSDIGLAIRACPETDEPYDLERGALFRTDDGQVWVNARSLLARVYRSCPVKFKPADFFVALRELGLLDLQVRRIGTWRGRVWAVPPSILPEVDALETNGHTPPPILEAAFDDSEPEIRQGAFDDLL